MKRPGRGLLVLGLGNPVLKDDAAGLRAVELAREGSGELDLKGRVSFEQRCIGGYDLLYEVEGYDALLVVDAFYRPGARPGRVRFLSPGKLALDGDAPLSAHLLNLPEALAIGRSLGYHVPELLGAVVIEVGDSCHEFGERLTGSVSEAVPEAARLICGRVREYLKAA